jgi:hypothetical protein
VYDLAHAIRYGHRGRFWACLCISTSRGGSNLAEVVVDSTFVAAQLYMDTITMSLR